MLPDYAELHCASNFSFLHGASHPEEFVDRAIALGYTALAITDECSLAGVVRAHVACRGKALKLIIGTEVQLTDGPRLVLLACSRRGYGRLAALITQARRAAPKGEYQLFCADLESGLEECLALYVSQGAPDRAALAWLAARFPGRAALAVSLTRGADDAQHLAQSIAAADEAGIPAVAATGALMHVRARHRLQQVLTAIRLNRTLAECGHALTVNAERHLRSRAVLADLYPPALLANAVALAARCQFSLDELRYEYPDEIVPAGSSPASALRALCEEGYTRRLDEIRRLGLDVSARAASLRDQIEHEISLIAELRFEAYFLTVHDIVRFARSRGILCQGRGSAANSAVCYALGITEVDPWRATMLFERFISKERNEPPDIDVDFEHHRREEVIQYLYQKYGRDRAALTAALITYRPKSALRDVGRALGFEPSRLDELNRNLAAWDGRHIHPERLGEMGFEVNSPQVKCWVELANALIGFPRHLSQHPGGFVISRGPLCELVPIENAAMEARTLIQWDKDDLDALGLLKVDVLALGMLSAIAKALALVGARRGAHFGMGDIPPEDSRVYDMISRADTMGVFQIESRAQMSMLPRLQPRCYYDLVIEVAIVRPGPIQGGMVHPYLRRRQGQEAVTYPSEAVRGVLSRTLGVPVFQEQVMQLAMVAAGFSAGQADQLRRAMAAWKRRGGLEPFEKQLIEGMLARGYSRDFAQSLFAQIAGFGEYGFPESHAASFALLVYVSAWLKCHEPAAFLCALLNSQPMGFYGPSQLIQDARRHGVEVRGVDVLESDWDCTLEGDAARLGLCMIAGLSQEAALRLVAARKKAAFATVQDMARRARLDARTLTLLAQAGALLGLSGHRRQAYWDASGAVTLPGVMSPATINEPLITLPAPEKVENLIADYQHLGYTLGEHPISMLRACLSAMRFTTASAVRSSADRALARAAGLVICRQRPGTASGVMFITLEDETGSTNVIVHPALVEKQRREVLRARLLGVYGQVQRDGEVVHLIAKRLVDHSDLLATLATRSRDFH